MKWSSCEYVTPAGNPPYRDMIKVLEIRARSGNRDGRPGHRGQGQAGEAPQAVRTSCWPARLRSLADNVMTPVSPRTHQRMICWPPSTSAASEHRTSS